ncbi:MAG: inorganic diphosphatase [Kofleriaceae bacterium]
MKKAPWIAALAPLWLCTNAPVRVIVGGAPVAAEATAMDDETILVDDFSSTPARDGGTVNCLVEIPAGTTAKFEIDDHGWLRWQKDRDDGSRRGIDYLPYVVNYGMVPSTLAPDGDPIDAIVLGRTIERGHLNKARVIGVLKMEQDGVRDDKLIAVPLDEPWTNGFSRLHELGELDHAYPNVREIVWTWFASYWGIGATHIIGWGDSGEANEILDEAIRARSRSPRASLALHLRGEPRSAPHDHD